MEFSSRRLADGVVAEPVGQIDHNTAPRLEQALAPSVDEIFGIAHFKFILQAFPSARAAPAAFSAPAAATRDAAPT